MDYRLHPSRWISLLFVVLVLVASGLRSQAAAGTGRILGVVRGPLGQPVRDAEARLVGWPATEKTLATARTDLEGRFAFEARAPGGYQVFATSPGLTTGVAGTTLAPGEFERLLQLRLWEAGTVHGRVVDFEAKPVAGVAVLASGDHPWLHGGFTNPEVVTGEDGSFRLEGVPIGAFTVRAAKAGHACSEKSGWLLQDAEVELRLERGAGCGLRIRVEGLPATAAAEVALSAMRGGGGFSIPLRLRRHQLARDGTCRIDGLPAAEWTIEVVAAGYGFQPRPARLALSAGDPVKELSFQAHAQGSLKVRGVLRTEEGQPIASHTLVCRQRSSHTSHEWTAATDVGGRFAMETSLAPGEPFSLRLVDRRLVLVQEKTSEHTGFWDKRYLGRHEAKADAERSLELVATRAGTVSGQVLDARGAPVPFLWMELQVQMPPNVSPRWGAMVYATSGLDGRYEFAGLPAIEEELRVTAEGTAGTACSEPMRLERGERRRKIDLCLRAAGVVEGRVLDADGRSLPGSIVSLRNCDVGTGEQTDGGWTNVLADREGRFRFVGVAPGGHRIDLLGDARPRDARLSSPVFAVEPGATVRQDLKVQHGGR
jgi:protocatechuate 3,4-dioxygenase beta subunit